MTQLLRNLGIGRRAINLTDVTSGYTGAAADQYGVDIKPSNDYIALAGTSTTNNLSVWSWNGSSTVSKVAQVDYGSPDFYSCNWHPTSSHIAVNIADTTNSVAVYSFTGGNTLTMVESQAMGSPGCSMVMWHPSGNFLAASGYASSDNVKVYSWNGTDTLTEVENVSLGYAIYTITWSPDGSYLSITTGDTTKRLAVYSWNGTDTLTEVATYDNGAVGMYDTWWTSDHAYLFACCNSTTASLKVFAFNGSALTLKQTVNAGFLGYTLDMYRDKYLAACYYTGSAGTNAYLKYYEFSRSTETLTEVDTWSIGGLGLLSVNFNSSGTYLAVGNYTLANKSFYVIRI